jgi:cytochrome c-type biogenesis protein
MTEVTLLAAFIAGVFSITSPCCLPLIPIFLAHVTSSSAGLSGARMRSVMLRHAGAYVAGFSLVFVALGAALGAAGVFASSLDFVSAHRDWIVRIGGGLLVVLGLHQLGWIAVPGFNQTRRVDFATGAPGSLPSSFLVGVSFGAAWSPCVGPILGAILTMAAGQGSVERATWLLTAYSLGMAIPFLVIAFAFGTVPTLIRSLNRRMTMVTTISGAVMIGVGVIMVLGIFAQLFTEIVRMAPWLPYEPSTQ